VALIRDEGICVRRWDWSETSQTAVVFSRGHGVLRVLAKGSKRERGAFSGGLELTHRAEFQAITKASSELSQLTSWDLAEVFPSVTRSAGAFYAASFALGAVELAVRDHDPHPRLYGALVDLLRSGATQVGSPEVVGFLWVLLDEAGFRPRLTREGGGADAGSVEFGPRVGRVLEPGEGDAGPTWRVRLSTIELLMTLEGADGAASGEGAGPVDGATWERAGRFLASYLREVLGRDMPGWEGFVGRSGG
jgi:DNA repair protein RecO